MEMTFENDGKIEKENRNAERTDAKLPGKN